MTKIREKESLECGRMHIWALKTQKLPGPLSGPWTPAANCSLRSRNSASLHRQLSASAPGAPPLTKSWIRTCSGSFCLFSPKFWESGEDLWLIFYQPVSADTHGGGECCAHITVRCFVLLFCDVITGLLDHAHLNIKEKRTPCRVFLLYAKLAMLPFLYKFLMEINWERL